MWKLFTLYYSDSDRLLWATIDSEIQCAAISFLGRSGRDDVVKIDQYWSAMKLLVRARHLRLTLGHRIYPLSD